MWNLCSITQLEHNQLRYCVLNKGQHGQFVNIEHGTLYKGEDGQDSHPHLHVLSYQLSNQAFLFSLVSLGSAITHPSTTLLSSHFPFQIDGPLPCNPLVSACIGEKRDYMNAWSSSVAPFLDQAAFMHVALYPFFSLFFIVGFREINVVACAF